MANSLAALSLILLVATIVLGFFRKLNVGLIAIPVSLFLGHAAGLKDSKIMGMFGTQLFLRLLGIMLILSVLQSNGTIEKITRKISSLSGTMIKILPILLFALHWVMSAVGIGGPSNLAMAAIIAVPLAYQLKISPIKLAPAAWWGGFAGVTGLGITGIVLNTVCTENGIDPRLDRYLITATVMQLIPFVIWYVASGWLKMEPEKEVTYDKGEPMNFANWAALGALLLMVFLTLVINIDIGLSAFTAGFLALLIPGVAEEKKVLSGISWGTLIMIGGMGMLISVVQAAGGIDLLSNLLSGFMTKTTAPAIMSEMGSVMSLVSSTTGVVMPTLIPTAPGIAESLGINPTELAFAITTGASQSAISPLSTGGALVMAAYGSIFQPTEEERQKLFLQTLILAIILGLAFFAMALLGAYHWFL